MQLYLYLPGGRALLTATLLLLLSTLALAQSVVTGQVTDPEGVPLIGVSVYPENNTAAGTVTDIDGQYTLNVTAEDENIVFSYVGYEQQLVPINGRTTVDVEMGESAETLEEVVVVAYGERQAEDVVGTVDQVTSREIENLQVNSFDQALSGQVAGVQVRLGSGRPDGGADILLRGVGTTGDNAPLIVIDGVPFGNYNAQNNNFLSLINPNDIESISVVRDATGSALYGSRAGNGLILITTKRGRPGKPTINVNLQSGVQTIPDYERPDNLNATELAQFLRERELDNGVAEADLPENLQNPEQYGEGTDWYDLITRTGMRNQADISVRGGTEQVAFSLSAGYTNNEGVVRETNFERYTLRATLDAEILPWLDVSAILAPSWTESNVTGTDPGTGQFQAYHILQVARWADPSAPAYDANGDLTLTTQGELLPFFQANPLYRLENTRETQTNRQLQSQLNLTVTPIEGLSFNQLVGANLLFNNGRGFSSGSVVGQGLTPNNPDPPANSSAAARRYESLRLISESTLNYVRTFGSSHNVEALAGYVAEFTQETFFNASGSRLLNEDFRLFNDNNIATFLPDDPETTRIFFNGGEDVSEQALVSYIGRLRYNYDRRYYLEGAIRRDASSRFGPGLEAAIFPAIAARWRVNRESWFPQNTAISSLEAEISIGETGNNRIGNYQYQGNVGRIDYVLGNGLAPGFTVTGLPNFFLGWEQISSTDIGLTVGLFQDRLNIEGVYYVKTTNDLLLGATPIPAVSGFTNLITNAGSIENRGVEFQIRSKPIVNDDLVWTLDANLSVNRNEVLSLGFQNTPIFTVRAGNGTTISRTIVGEPVSQYYGLQITGLFTPEELANSDTPRYPGAVAGSPNYVDGDGDGLLELQDDYVFLGNPFPDFVYGLTSFVTWKDFGLRIVGNGEQGSLIFDLSREIELNTDGVFNVRQEVQDRFRPGSEDFSIRPPTTSSVQSSQRFRAPSSQSVVNGSFFRISNIALSYRLDRMLEAVPGISGATVSLAVQNAFVFSPFYGNPEVGRASGPLERNINYNTYPQVRTFTLGLSASL